MAAHNLFEGLPPPAAGGDRAASPSPPPPVVQSPSALKSALKRDKPSSDSTSCTPAATTTPADVAAEGLPEKRPWFRTTVDASEMQITQAVQKITSHIGNTSKFRAYNEPSVCLDYQALFNAAQSVTEFSKAVGKIKDAISALPVATVDADNDEAAALAVAERKSDSMVNKADDSVQAAVSNSLPDDSSTHAAASSSSEESTDPFGLDDLLEHKSKKSGRAREKAVPALNRTADEESKRFLWSQREALPKCLEIAARCYRIPWTQTTINIFGKHAYDNVSRFTRRQRDAIEKLWNSIKEQQIRRKQGKSVSGKLDVNAFERLQEKYSHEKISIRRAVGGEGDRRATQWLG